MKGSRGVRQLREIILTQKRFHMKPKHSWLNLLKLNQACCWWKKMQIDPHAHILNQLDNPGEDEVERDWEKWASLSEGKRKNNYKPREGSEIERVRDRKHSKNQS